MSDTFIGDFGGSPVNDFMLASPFTKLYGIAGNDSLGTSAAGPVYLEGGTGDDMLLAAGSSTFGDFYGGGGNDFIIGGNGSDYIEGGNGRDALVGAGGNDVIYGGDGNESGALITAGASSSPTSPGLFGGAGNDYLDGGRGDDLLDGGLGTDELVGGRGNDIFRFNNIAESPKGKLRDIIIDFKKGDKIDVSGIDAKPGGGNDAFKFIGKKGFHDKAGELRFKGNKVQADTNGDGKADFEVMVLDVSKLKGADFIL